MLAEERFSLIMEQLDRKRTVTVQADQGARRCHPAGQPFSGG